MVDYFPLQVDNIEKRRLLCVLSKHQQPTERGVMWLLSSISHLCSGTITQNFLCTKCVVFVCLGICLQSTCIFSLYGPHKTNIAPVQTRLQACTTSCPGKLQLCNSFTFHLQRSPHIGGERNFQIQLSHCGYLC